MSKSTVVLQTRPLESLFHHTQKDDFTVFVFLICTGIFYQFFFKDKPDPHHHLWFEKPQAAESGARGIDTRDISVKLAEAVSKIQMMMHTISDLQLEERSRYLLGLTIRNSRRPR